MVMICDLLKLLSDIVEICIETVQSECPPARSSHCAPPSQSQLLI